VTLSHGLSSPDNLDPAYDAKSVADSPRFALTVLDDDRAGLFLSSSKLFLGCDFDGNVMFGDQYVNPRLLCY